jgi:hypothetical protein
MSGLTPNKAMMEEAAPSIICQVAEANGCSSFRYHWTVTAALVFEQSMVTPEPYLKVDYIISIGYSSEMHSGQLTRDQRRIQRNPATLEWRRLGVSRVKRPDRGKARRQRGF